MKNQFSFGLAFGALSVLGSIAWSQPADTTPIYTIQGNGPESPLKGKTVTTQGVVTASFPGKEGLNGFFLQDVQGDGDPKTSDGIYVYLSARSPLATTVIKAGDAVKVRGRVVEYDGITELSVSGREAALAVVGTAPVPAPVEVKLPFASPDGFEAFEGMLVTFPQTLTVSGTHELIYSGAVDLSSNGRMFVSTNGSDDDSLKGVDSGARHFLLDDGRGGKPDGTPYLDAQHTRRVGDTIAGVTGVLTVEKYGFGKFSYSAYALEPTVAPKFESANSRPAKPADVGGKLKIVSFNMHNYWTTFQNEDKTARGAANAAEFERQAAKNVSALVAMDGDVVGLIEMENNGGKSIDDIVARLNAAYGAPTYAAVPSPATGVGTDRIQVAIIYKPAKVSLQGASLSATDAIFDRKPFAQTFAPKDGSAPFTLIVNHFKSKGSGPEDPNDPNFDKGQGAWNLKRVAQSQALLAFVARLQTDGVPDILAVGDFNAYGAEDPIKTLSGDLTLLNDRLPKEQRYSFVYGAFSGSLDWAFATKSLDARVSGLDEWHINADEPEFLDETGPNTQALKALGRGTVYRSSDHDPLIIGLN